MMVEVGQRVRFDPLEHIDECGAASFKGHYVIGTVVDVYPKHNWFSVEYGNKARISFHFWDIGKVVTICERNSVD